MYIHVGHLVGGKGRAGVAEPLPRNSIELREKGEREREKERGREKSHRALGTCWEKDILIDQTCVWVSVARQLTRCSKTSPMVFTTPLVVMATRSFNSVHSPPGWKVDTTSTPHRTAHTHNPPPPPPPHTTTTTHSGRGLMSYCGRG